MPDSIITHFDRDPDKERMSLPCIDHYDVGEADANWPNNILARGTVVYSDGKIASTGDTVTHRVDAEELALCQRLAHEAGEIMSGVEIGMGSESGDTFHPFYVTANVGDDVPDRIDEKLIRAKFGQTIFPPSIITVEPLKESGIWWSEVQYDVSEDDDEGREEYLQPWRNMIAWFREQDFQDTAFVRIGDFDEFSKLDESRYPPGTELTPCALPRFALGLTKHGSIVGLFGVSVQT